jgi:hypothetical protein
MHYAMFFPVIFEVYLNNLNKTASIFYSGQNFFLCLLRIQLNFTIFRFIAVLRCVYFVIKKQVIKNI